MRALALLAVAAVTACGSPPATPVVSTLTVSGDFAAPTQPPPGLSIATAALHVVELGAVSDRSSSDLRTQVEALDLAMAGTVTATLPSAPPALYSGLRFTLGDAMTSGVDLTGAFGTARLHVMLSNAPVYVSCADPLPLDPGGRVELLLHADLAHWFDGVDLTATTSDSDDNGILISADDNPVLAARITANIEASFQLDCRSM